MIFKKIFLVFLLNSFLSLSQNNIDALSFKEGEFLKYKIHYGLLNAGFMSLELNSVVKDNKSLFHVNGKGWTTGVVDFVFSVEDNYQTYFDKNNLQPYHFIRKINEGGYTKNKEIYFDFTKHQAKVVNNKHHTEKSFFIQNDVKDMLSSLFYLRSLDLSDLGENDTIIINMFFDEQMNKIKLRFKKRDIINTKFGKVKALVFMPLVQSGRVFKGEETVTLWISDDKNKVPLKIKASILVGSIKAELIEYKGLSNSFPIIFN